ncbi:DUF1788 domain-containing protein [Peijinzhouia sedimentorum]
MDTLGRKFNHIYNIASTKSFLQKEALGGEIPFFISSYSAKDEIRVREEIKRLKNKLSTQGINVLEINLFDIACQILEDKGGIDRLFKVEKTKGSEKFLRALQSALNIHEVLLPRIKTLIMESDAQIYFITGVGLVFPYIRSHNILNNLQSVAKDAPTITFFPGEYNGHSLNLFGLLKDDNYYRAFNIESIKA